MTARKVNYQQVGWELERTAMNDGYYPRALEEALEITELSDEERALLKKFLTGLSSKENRDSLKNLAVKIYDMKAALSFESISRSTMEKAAFLSRKEGAVLTGLVMTKPDGTKVVVDLDDVIRKESLKTKAYKTPIA